MGLRGELFTTHVVLDNRSYFFNVKENRTGDVFLQVVESKNIEGAKFDRHAIVIFEEDMQQFFRGLDESLAFISKARKQKKKDDLEKKVNREAAKTAEGKKMYRRVVTAVSSNSNIEKAVREATGAIRHEEGSENTVKKEPKKVRIIRKK